MPRAKATGISRTDLPYQETGWCTRKQLIDATAVSVNKARAALGQLQQVGRSSGIY